MQVRKESEVAVEAGSGFDPEIRLITPQSGTNQLCKPLYTDLGHS